MLSHILKQSIQLSNLCLRGARTHCHWSRKQQDIPSHSHLLIHTHILVQINRRLLPITFGHTACWYLAHGADATARLAGTPQHMHGKHIDRSGSDRARMRTRSRINLQSARDPQPHVAFSIVHIQHILQCVNIKESTLSGHHHHHHHLKCILLLWW